MQCPVKLLKEASEMFPSVNYSMESSGSIVNSKHCASKLRKKNVTAVSKNEMSHWKSEACQQSYCGRK